MVPCRGGGGLRKAYLVAAAVAATAAGAIALAVTIDPKGGHLLFTNVKTVLSYAASKVTPTGGHLLFT